MRKGATVKFRSSDVFLPGREDLQQFSSDLEEIEGVIVDFSDSGVASQAFAVVEITLKRTVIVPADKLIAVDNGSMG